MFFGETRAVGKVVSSEQRTTQKYTSHDDKRGFQHKIIIYDTSSNIGLPTIPKNLVQMVHDSTLRCTKLRSLVPNDRHFLGK
jgi:hypothetical protein